MTDHSEALRRAQKVEDIYEQAKEFGVLSEDGVWTVYDKYEIARLDILMRPVRTLAPELARDVSELVAENKRLRKELEDRKANSISTKGYPKSRSSGHSTS